jgi:hypothetical protein
MNSAEGLGLIHDDLLQQLSAKAVRRDLRLGKVFDLHFARSSVG